MDYGFYMNSVEASVQRGSDVANQASKSFYISLALDSVMLTQLFYVSRPSEGVTIRDVEDILQTARKFNKEHDITGALLFRSEYFIQALEGSRGVVMELYRKISGDPRHCDVKMIGMRETSERIFPEWSMGFVSLRADSITDRYKSFEALDPAYVTTDTILEFMNEVARLETDPSPA